MRLGTTIAAVVLVGSLTSSTAELSGLSTPPAPTAPTATGPPAAVVAPVATSTTDGPATVRPNRTATPSAGRVTDAAPSWSVNLSAGEGAGVEMASGAVRLDPDGVFLAPLEDGSERGAAGTGSTGADPGPGRASTEGAPAAGTPVPTGLLTLPIQRLSISTLRVDSIVIGRVPTGSTASMDVRGRDADGNWSEWIPTGVGPTGAPSTVMLPEPAVAVQGRLVLTGAPFDLTDGLTGPAVRGVTLTAHPVSPAGPSTPASSIARSTTTTPTTTPTLNVQGSAAPTTPVTRPISATLTTTPTTTPTADAKADAKATTTTEASKATSTTTSSSKTTSKTTSSKTTSSKTTASKTTTPSASASASASANANLKYRVFATREGLVGRTTANGHKIKSSDRFVALPSRRALSPQGRTDYSVKVCAANGRCAVAPVWDVGPWNTRDDYWNPPSRRQEWRDLPQGMPEAQAAKERGYNGGRDQFKRKVANPAGIDLSDGLFWGALGLKDNGWVTVEYLWTGANKG